VLDVKDGKALILSDRVLTSHQYHSSNSEITWENCSMRAYLNGSFIDNTFTADEKKYIAEQRIENKNNPTHGTTGGIATIDKIFLLSIEEVNTYFTDDSSRIAYNMDNNSSLWWLRSPGLLSYSAARVGRDGGVYSHGNFVDSNDGVRPALWLNL